MTDRLLKKPNVQRGGVSQVRLDAAGHWPELAGEVVIKEQRGYYCHPAWNGFRRTPLVRRECRALLACRKAGVHVPLVLRYREHAGAAELVTSFIPGALTLNVALERFGAQRGEIMRNVGREVGKLHGAWLVHGALYPIHILICPEHEFRAYLVDLEKAGRSLKRGRDLARFARYNAYLTADDWNAFADGYQAGAGRLPPLSE